MRLTFFVCLLLGVGMVSGLNLTTIYNETFTGISTGWTGGTLDTANDWYDSTTNWATWTSEDVNLSSYTFSVLCWRGWSNANHTTHKIRFYETASSSDGDHLLMDNSGGNARWRPEPGYSPAFTHPYGRWFSYCVYANTSSDVYELYVNGTQRWTRSGTIDNTSGRDYSRFEIGDLDGSEYRMTNFSVQVLSEETGRNTGGGGGGGGGPNEDNLSPYEQGLLNASAEGYNSETRARNYEDLLMSQWNAENITVYYSVGGVNYTHIPWHDSSTACSESNLKTTCGAHGNWSSNCLVTDEFTQKLLVDAASQNASNAWRLQSSFNTYRLLNASSGGYGYQAEWLTVWDNMTGTPRIVLNYTDDTASDADAMAILALRIMNTSSVYADTSLDQKQVGGYLTTLCRDFVEHAVLKTNKVSYVNNSKNITYYPCGGSNVCTSLTNNDFMYTGYHGRIAMAMIACAAHTNNGTYYNVSHNIVESYFAAANYTPAGGLKFPPGRAYKWTSGNQPNAVCTTVCSPAAYVDDPDGMRYATLCSADHMSETHLGLSLHPWLDGYCEALWSDVGVTPLTYSKEWWYNGTRKSTPVDSYEAMGLAMSIDIGGNQTNLNSRFNEIGTKWDNTNKRFTDMTCEGNGIYNPSLAMEGMLYSLGYADSAFKNTSTLVWNGTGGGTPDEEPAPSGVGGGGGGGGSCGIDFMEEEDTVTYAHCVQGTIMQPLEFTIKNTDTSAATVTFTSNQPGCLLPESTSFLAEETKTLSVAECGCPGDGNTSWVTITARSGVCTDTLNLELHNNGGISALAGAPLILVLLAFGVLVVAWGVIRS